MALRLLRSSGMPKRTARQRQSYSSYSLIETLCSLILMRLPLVAAEFMTNEAARAVFGETESLVAPQVAAFIVRHKNVPVAAAMTLIAARVAGIYFVGTVPEARGRGLGELSTRAATNAGFDLGAGAAILQASVAGEPLYRRMGYQLLTRYRCYRSTFDSL